MQSASWPPTLFPCNLPHLSLPKSSPITPITSSARSSAVAHRAGGGREGSRATAVRAAGARCRVPCGSPRPATAREAGRQPLPPAPTEIAKGGGEGVAGRAGGSGRAEEETHLHLPLGTPQKSSLSSLSPPSVLPLSSLCPPSALSCSSGPVQQRGEGKGWLGGLVVLEELKSCLICLRSSLHLPFDMPRKSSLCLSVFPRSSTAAKGGGEGVAGRFGGAGGAEEPSHLPALLAAPATARERR
ncbi:unnamed protein product [Closterium sp. Naga37s-1]|nr:unnamed protein product [Closterium sp. Naga37s-1]